MACSLMLELIPTLKGTCLGLLFSVTGEATARLGAPLEPVVGLPLLAAALTVVPADLPLLRPREYRPFRSTLRPPPTLLLTGNLPIQLSHTMPARVQPRDPCNAILDCFFFFRNAILALHFNLLMQAICPSS